MSSLRPAFRQLARSPGFTAVALLTLALGIGVNTAMFSLVNTLLLKSAPYIEPDRLLRIYRTTPQSQTSWHSAADLLDLDAQNTVFEKLAWFDWATFSLAEPGQPAERVPGLSVSADFFAALGTQPALGRGFSSDNCIPGGDNVVVLSHGFWRQRFGGDPNIVGRSIRLNAANVTVIGVMPASVDDPVLWGRVDAWHPLALSPEERQNRRSHWMHAIARLKPGISLAAARTELGAFSDRWAKAYPDTNAAANFRLVVLQESAMDATGRSLPWLVFGLTGFVLLIACANLANLQLARTAARARSYALRSALGASRSRLIRELLAESLLLAVGGGILGLVLAQWLTAFISQRMAVGENNALAVSLDVRVLAFALLSSLTTGALFGLIPAWLSSRTNLNAVLQRQARGSTGDRSQHRLRNILIIGEVALALTLLTGAGFFIRGLQRAMARDLGWNREHVVTAALSLPETLYDTDEKLLAFYPQFVERLRSLPGVEHAALASSLPVGTYHSSRGVIPEGPPPPPPAQAPSAFHVYITPDFFSTLGGQLLQGRFFAADIRGDSPRVAIVNESLARQLWPGEDPIGQRIGGARAENREWAEVVGVVRDIGFAGELGAPRTRLQVYLPLVQGPGHYFQLALRLAAPKPDQGGANAALVGVVTALRQIIADIDPELPAYDIRTVEQTIALRSTNFHLANRLLAGFAALGLLLTAIGLYGVISNLVVQRTSEFGIRLALGAQPRDILRQVLGRGLRLITCGAALGLAGSVGLFRLFAAVVPVFPGEDYFLLTATVLVLLIVALLACWLPARRATKIDPLVALRAE